jgi:hypothetical protein
MNNWLSYFKWDFSTFSRRQGSAKLMMVLTHPTSPTHLTWRWSLCILVRALCVCVYVCGRALQTASSSLQPPCLPILLFGGADKQTYSTFRHSFSPQWTLLRSRNHLSELSFTNCSQSLQSPCLKKTLYRDIVSILYVLSDYIVTLEMGSIESEWLDFHYPLYSPGTHPELNQPFGYVWVRLMG